MVMSERRGEVREIMTVSVSMSPRSRTPGFYRGYGEFTNGSMLMKDSFEQFRLISYYS